MDHFRNVFKGKAEPYASIFQDAQKRVLHSLILHKFSMGLGSKKAISCEAETGSG